MKLKRSLGVRRTVVVTATTVLALSLGATGIFVRARLRQALEQSITDQMTTRAEAVAEIENAAELDPLIDPSDRVPGWVQVIVGDKVVASTPNVGNFHTPLAPLKPRPGRDRVVRKLHSLAVDPDDDMIVVAVPTKVRGEPGLVLTGAPLDLTDANDQRTIAILLIAFPSLLGISALVIWLATKRSLRPVEAIRSQVAAITATTDLARRVPVPNSDDEIHRLATTMNDTLDHLEAASMRQRRFVADASHELRSPLASLRSQLEMTMITSTDPDRICEAENMRIDLDRVEQLVADLLILARLDEGEKRILEPIDVAHLVRSEVARRPAVPGLDVHVIMTQTGPDAPGASTIVNGNETDLSRVIRNLVDNAQRHALTTVEVSVATQNHDVVVRLQNDGTPIPDDELDRIFERFHRLDEARSSDEGGSGLGLAIVRELVHAHGGSVRAEPTATGASFVVLLPQIDT